MLTSVSNKPRCILICIGSELLRGKINTHASHIAQRLASIGLALDEENTISDNLPEITGAIKYALGHFPVIFVSGGLGPTFDDLTREAASEATGRSLVLSKALVRGLKNKFKRAKYAMPAANMRQAYLLEGARAIENKNGTAPGQWLVMGDQVVILLPGPPRELYPMLEAYVLPHLKKQFPPLPTTEAHLHFIGAPESVVDAKVRPIIEREQKRVGAKVEFTILAHLALVDFDVFVSAEKITQARITLTRIVKAVRAAVGDAWYGSDQDYPLEKVVADRFKAKRTTLAVAESCTGGMLASRLTDVPGSSEYLLAGYVTYSNATKIRDLGVGESELKKYGAVSSQVALSMARGVRARAGTTCGIGITGIAGPGGGTSQKPVGLVYIGAVIGNKAQVKEYRFSGGRSVVRERSVLAALDLLRKIKK